MHTINFLELVNLLLEAIGHCRSAKQPRPTLSQAHYAEQTQTSNISNFCAKLELLNPLDHEIQFRTPNIEHRAGTAITDRKAGHQSD